MTRHRIAALVTLLGIVVVAAHGILGAAGVMTAAQWQSGALIGSVLLVGGGSMMLATR